MNLFRMAANEFRRRAAGRDRKVDLILFLLPMGTVVTVLGLAAVMSIIAAFIIAGMSGNGCGTSVPVGPPSAATKTGAEAVAYFQSQGISAYGAAGIVGNLMQESGLNPEDAGGYLAQWGGSRQSAMLTWTAKAGYPANSPNPQISMTGQLMYIVYDLRTSYATLLAALNAAPDPGTAATAFETVYELCSGVSGFMQVAPGSACNDPNRRQQAVLVYNRAAGTPGGALLVAAVTPGAACVVGSGGYVNPLSRIAGLAPSRIDMGVDYTGAGPVLAVGDGQIVNTNAHGWPGLSFIEERLSGGTFAGKCWYAAENIAPTVSPGQTVKAGQQIGILHAGYPWSEFGWGVCTGGTTLAASLHQQAGRDPGGWSSAAGASASRFLQSLGAPPGQMQSGGPHGQMPPGYS